MKIFHSSSGVLIKYDVKNKELILQSVCDLQDEIKQSNNALFIRFGVSIPLHNLAKLLQINECKDEILNRHFIFDGIMSLPNTSSPNISEFLESVAIKLNEYIRKENQEFHVLFPINISEGIFTADDEIRINNIKIKIDSWDNVQNKYQIGQLLKIIGEKLHSPFDLNYLKQLCTPITGIVFEKDSRSAFRRVEEKVEIFRSILNFFEDDWITIHLDWPIPLSLIRKTGYYGVFSKNGDLIEPFGEQLFTTLRTNNKLEKTSPNKINDFIKSLNSRKQSRSISETITKALKSYASGLDTPDYSSAYLAFWQCIETVTMLSNKNYSMEDVVVRIQRLNNLNDIVNKYFLSLCAERRNDLVHKGIFNIEGESEVQLLKIIARFCLLNFLNKKKIYKNHFDFENYYKFANLNQSQIKSIKSVVDTLTEQ